MRGGKRLDLLRGAIPPEVVAALLARLPSWRSRSACEHCVDASSVVKPSMLYRTCPADREPEASRYGGMVRGRFCTKLFAVASGGCLERGFSPHNYRHAAVEADQ